MGKRKHHDKKIKTTPPTHDAQEEAKAVGLLMELAKDKDVVTPQEPPQLDLTAMHKELLEHHRQNDIKRRNAVIAKHAGAQPSTPPASLDTSVCVIQ